jgi:hypothetical protein
MYTLLYLCVNFELKTVITYPPSSPDVALCHLLLFQKLKMVLQGRKFNDYDMIQAELEDALGQISSSALQ